MKKIFEKDIARIERNGISRVVSVEYHEECMSFVLRGDLYYFYNEKMFCDKKYFVIGDIYKNRELLNV